MTDEIAMLEMQDLDIYGTIHTTARLEDCITDIMHWISANRLKLDKTEWLPDKLYH